MSHRTKFNLPELPVEHGVITMPPNGTGYELSRETRQFQMAYQLQEMISADRHNASLPPLPDLSRKKHIAKNWDKYRVHGPKRIYTDVIDIVAHRGFSAVYPQTFTPISRYFLDKGISPPYIVHEDEDHNYGVITIASMIELVENDIPWRLADDRDISVILELCYRYKNTLEPYAADHIPDNDAKFYYFKIDRFIQYMDRERHDVEMHTRKPMDVRGKDLASIFKIMGLI